MVSAEDTSEPQKFSRSIDLLAAKHCRVHILTAEEPFKLEVWERRGGRGVDIDVQVGDQCQSASFVKGRRGWSEPQSVGGKSDLIAENEWVQAALRALPESARRHIIPER